MFEEHLQNTLNLLRGNPEIALAALLVVALLFYSKPKEMFKLVAFALFLVVAFYIMTLLMETVGVGTKQKDEVIYKTEGKINE